MSRVLIIAHPFLFRSCYSAKDNNRSEISPFRKHPKIPSEDFRTRQASSLSRFARTLPARRLERFSR